ncbi:MAG TPA: hypothetical protein PKM88_10430 [bacterium]|nr:hypothetical protein [bacterium]
MLNRFVDRHPFFHTRDDYRHFLDTYFSIAPNFSIRTFAYSLLPNHFHLLLQVTENNISAFLRSFLSRIARALNAHHNRAGHLFQGRSKTLLVQDDCYFHTALGYVLLNATRARLCADIYSYPWDSVGEMLHPSRCRIARQALGCFLVGDAFAELSPAEQIRWLRQWLPTLDPDTNLQEFQQAHRGCMLGSAGFRQRVLQRSERRIVNQTGSRRKADRPHHPYQWQDFVSAAQHAVDKTENGFGGWRNSSAAVRCLTYYLAHEIGCWPWRKVCIAAGLQESSVSRISVATTRLRRNPVQLNIAQSATTFLLSTKCSNVEE